MIIMEKHGIENSPNSVSLETCSHLDNMCQNYFESVSKRNSFTNLKSQTSVDQEESKRSNHLSSKHSISPVLSYGKTKKLRNSSSKRIMNKSPDLSLTAKSRKIKRTISLDFTSKKSFSPDIKLELQNGVNMKNEFEKLLHKNETLSIDDSLSKEFKEPKVYQNHLHSSIKLSPTVTSTYNLKMRNDVEEKRKQKITEFRESINPTLLENREKDNYDSENSSFESPDLSLHTSKPSEKHVVSSKRKSIRKNLFNNFEKEKVFEKPELHKSTSPSQNISDSIGHDKNIYQEITRSYELNEFGESYKNSSKTQELSLKCNKIEFCRSVSSSPLVSRLISYSSDSPKLNEISVKGEENFGRKENMPKENKICANNFVNKYISSVNSFSKMKLNVLKKNAMRQNEISKRYGILPVTFKKCKSSEERDNKPVISSKSFSNYDPQLDADQLAVSNDIFISSHEINRNQSLSGLNNYILHDKTLNKNHYTDSNKEIYKTPEVLSPLPKKGIKAQEKSSTQIKINSCNKVISFDKTRFESVFETSNLKKKLNSVYLFQTSLSERYNELSEMLRKPIQDELKISDSSESSPEEKQKMYKMKSRNTYNQLRSKHLLKKLSMTPMLEVEISSPKLNLVPKTSIGFLHEKSLNQKIISDTNKNSKKDVAFQKNSCQSNEKSNLRIAKSLDCDPVRATEKSLSSVGNNHDAVSDALDEQSRITGLKRDAVVLNNSDKMRIFNNEEKVYFNEIEEKTSLENNVPLQCITPEINQASELFIESVSSPSNAGSNGTVFEIEFSDASSLQSQPRTPPSKLIPGNPREFNVMDSSSKKRKKKYPHDSLIGRLWSVRNRYESHANLLHYMLTKKRTELPENDFPVFIVKKISYAYSKMVILCHHVDDTGSGIRKEENRLSDKFSITRELLVVMEPTFTSDDIVTSSHIKIHPPWQVLDNPDENLVIILRPSCLEVVTKPETTSLLSENIHENCERSSIVTIDFKCCCHQDFVLNPDCRYEFSDELFAEEFCPPPKELSHSCKLQKKRLSKLYFNENHLKGTIGHGRAFTWLNPLVNVVGSVTTLHEKFEFLDHGNLFVVIKDSAEELAIVILITESDIEKWKSTIHEPENAKQNPVKINGLKFTHRIPIKRCKAIFEKELIVTSQVQQNYIYCLSPTYNWWIDVENKGTLLT